MMRDFGFWLLWVVSVLDVSLLLWAWNLVHRVADNPDAVATAGLAYFPGIAGLAICAIGWLLYWLM